MLRSVATRIVFYELDEAFISTLPEESNNYAEDNCRGVGQWSSLPGQCGSSTRMELAAWI